MFKKINQDLQKAMKEKNKERLEVLRMVKSRILLVNARGDLPEPEIIKIISKYAKSLKEAIEETKKVNRGEEVKKLESELKIVEEYLPKALSEEELKALVNKAIQETGASSMKDMGKVMKACREQSPAADGKLLSTLVRAVLSAK